MHTQHSTHGIRQHVRLHYPLCNVKLKFADNQKRDIALYLIFFNKKRARSASENKLQIDRKNLQVSFFFVIIFR